MEVELEGRAQLNVQIEARLLLVLRVVAEAESTTVPELLRPVVERYARSRLRDEHIAGAVENLERYRAEKADRAFAKRTKGKVAKLPESTRGRPRGPGTPRSQER